MENSQQPERRLVTLLQCGKSRCGHVLTEAEYDWKPDLERDSFLGKTAYCPKCGGDSFYTLNAQGQARRMSDPGPREIDPETIEPSPRMGLKMRRRLLAAKRRAIARNTQPSDAKGADHGS